eukprot:gene18589-25332_t
MSKTNGKRKSDEITPKSNAASSKDDILASIYGYLLESGHSAAAKVLAKETPAVEKKVKSSDLDKLETVFQVYKGQKRPLENDSQKNPTKKSKDEDSDDDDSDDDDEESDEEPKKPVVKAVA